MDLSILKLLEQDEVESMHSVEEIDALQSALNRDIQGKSYSPSQQLVTGNNNVVGDANTNLHTLENTRMKEQQRSVLVNQEQGLKLSIEQTRRVEQPVDSMNHGSTSVNLYELFGIVHNQVDQNKKRQLNIMYDKYKRKEIAKDVFFAQIRSVAGVPLINSALRMYKLRHENTGIRAPGCSSNSVVSSPSAAIKDQKSDPRGVHVSMMTDPKSERPTSVNGPSKFQGVPISMHLDSATQQGSVTKDQTVSPLSSVAHVKQEPNYHILDQAQKPRSLVQQTWSNVPVKQNNDNPRISNNEVEQQSYKMGVFPSTTNASFVSPSMKTQLESSTMVNLPGPSVTITPGATVKIAEMPSSGRKNPLETLGSSLPPPGKKQKVGSTSSNQSIAQLNDITASSGVNIEEEEHLLVSGPKKDGHVSEAARRIVRQEEERTILQKIPLQRKLAEIVAKSGLKKISSDVERSLSLCVEERMRGILSNIIRVSKQRTDAEKSRHRTYITSDIRKQINEMNQKMKEELERKQAEDKELKNAENVTENKDKRLKEEEDRRKAEEKDKMRAKAANVAAHAAIGGNDVSLKWKLKAQELQKQSLGGSVRHSKKPCAETGGRGLGKKQGSPKVVRSISVKDVIEVVGKEPQMSRSTLLYRLYNRIGSDVQS